MANKILESSDPKIQKELGRRVRNFDPSVWSDHCDDIVKLANYIKVYIYVISTIIFTQKCTMYIPAIIKKWIKISLLMLQQVDLQTRCYTAACAIKLNQCLYY